MTVKFIKGGLLFETRNHRHCQPKGRRRQNNNDRQFRDQISKGRKKVLLIDADPQGSISCKCSEPRNHSEAVSDPRGSRAFGAGEQYPGQTQ